MQVARWAAEHGADLADVSTGGNVSSAPIPVGPGYQVPFAAAVKREAGIGTIAVGMISDAFQAEQIVATGQADVVMVGREFLRATRRSPCVRRWSSACTWTTSRSSTNRAR